MYISLKSDVNFLVNISVFLVCYVTWRPERDVVIVRCV